MTRKPPNGSARTGSQQNNLHPNNAPSKNKPPANRLRRLRRLGWRSPTSAGNPPQPARCGCRGDDRTPAILHGASGTTEAQHETSDVGLNILIAAGAIVGGLIIIALIAVSLLTNVFYSSPETRQQGRPPIATAAPPAAVEIRVNPVSALEHYQAASRDALNRYGWVDEAAGVARVPITRAMELITEGLTPAVGQNET